MSKQIWTSDELVAGVRDALSCSNSTATGSDDARILKHLNLAMLMKVVPEMLKTREEYFVTATDQTLSASTRRYRIPERAFLSKLRTLFLVVESDNKVRLREVQAEDLWRWDSESAGGSPAAYYLEGLDVVLLPATGVITGTLEMSFYFRPNDLVLTSEARQIISIDLALKRVTVSPAKPDTFLTTARFDIHGQTSGGQMKAWDLVATAIDINTPVANQDRFTFSTAIDGTVKGRRPVEVGDWLCLAGEAVVPMLPKEMHGILVDAAALRLLKALGDQPNIQSQAGILAGDLDGMTTVTERRNEGQPLRIRGRKGLLWGGRR